MSRSSLVGLILPAPAPRVGVEPFFMELVAGLEEALAASGRRVLLLVVPDQAAEAATYRRWARDRVVEAVVVVDLVEGDTRPALLHDIALPAVLAGRHDGPPAMTRVVTDDAGAMTTAIELLVGLDHRVIGRVSGPAPLLHTWERTAAMVTAAARLGVQVHLVESDYSSQGGVRGAVELLAAPQAPTALVFDNDVMALGALGHLTGAGVRVPDEVSLLSLNDSALCDLSVPPLSSLRIMDVHDHGARLGRAVLEVLAGEPAREHPGPAVQVVARASTAPPAPLPLPLP